MDINQAVKPLINPVLNVWNSIGHDLMRSFEDMGEELDNESAIECCLDADHLLLTGEDAVAHALCKDLCLRYGFTEVVRAIGRQIRLA